MPPPLDRLVLGRLAFGYGSDTATRFRADGLERWVDSQLAAPAADDAGTAARLAAVRLKIKYDATEHYPAVDEMRPLTTLGKDVSQLWRTATEKDGFAYPERQLPRQELAAATILRAVHSPWQLREVMVGFWHDHFNVNAVGDQMVAAALPDYDRTLRSHALGNFREFLEAVAKSPAMLIYLNNRSSRAGIANENYARELLELHTLGRGAYLNDLYSRWKEVPGAPQGRPSGYIDQDVYEAARAFTGWAVEDGSGLGGGQSLPATGRFVYVEGWHDNYQKRVLATDFDPFQPPLADGRKVLDLVAFHPATARYVCTRLCRRLVADEPPEALVAGAAKVWSDNARARDQIARVVAHIAKSAAARQNFGAKVKRPLELVASYARAAGLDLTVTNGLLGELDGSGQKLFGWPPPTGHPDTGAYWLGSHVLRKRWSLLLGLSENWWGTGVFEPAAALGRPMAAGETAALWHQRLTGEAPDAATAAAILGGMRLDPKRPLGQSPDDARTLRRVAAYCAMTPAFNLR